MHWERGVARRRWRVAGAKVRGPAVWQGPESTLLVPEGWAGAVDETATLVLERTR